MCGTYTHILLPTFVASVTLYTKRDHKLRNVGFQIVKHLFTFYSPPLLRYFTFVSAIQMVDINKTALFVHVLHAEQFLLIATEVLMVAVHTISRTASIRELVLATCPRCCSFKLQDSVPPPRDKHTRHNFMFIYSTYCLTFLRTQLNANIL